MIKRYITEQTFEYDRDGYLVRETITTTEEHDDNDYRQFPAFNPYPYWYLSTGIDPVYAPAMLGPVCCCDTDNCDEIDCETAYTIDDEVEFQW